MENRKTMGFRIENKDFSWIFQLELLYESIRVYFQGLFDKTSVLSRSTKNNSRRLRVFECSGNCCMIEWMCNSVTKMFLMYPNVVFGMGLQWTSLRGIPSQLLPWYGKGGTGKASREEDEDDEAGSQCHAGPARPFPPNSADEMRKALKEMRRNSPGRRGGGS